MPAFCVRFLFFPYQIRLGGTSLKWPILCGVGRKTTTQLIHPQSCSFLLVVFQWELCSVEHNFSFTLVPHYTTGNTDTDVWTTCLRLFVTVQWPGFKLVTIKSHGTWSIPTLLLLLHLFNGLFSRTAWVSQVPAVWISMNLDMMRFLWWQWHQLCHMRTVCTSLQTDNHTSTSSLCFYRPDALPSSQPTVSKHWRSLVPSWNKAGMWLIVELLNWVLLVGGWLGSRVVSLLDSGAEGPRSNCGRGAVG